MSFATCLMHPIVVLLTTVKWCTLQNRFAVLFAYFIRYFSKLVSVADLVAKFFAVLKGNAIHYKMIVNIFGVEVGSDYNLKSLAPNPS